MCSSVMSAVMLSRLLRRLQNERGLIPGNQPVRRHGAGLPRPKSHVRHLDDLSNNLLSFHLTLQLT